MRKWLIAFLAGSIVIGCAGGTGTGTTGTPTTGTDGGSGGTTGDPIPTVVLPTTYADARVVFLSGSGRTGQGRAPGSLYVKLNNIRFANGPADIIPTDISGSLDGVNMRLDGYTVNKYSFTQQMASVPGKVYNSLLIDMTQMSEENLFGNINVVYDETFSIPEQTVIMPFAPGRQSTLQVFLSDASLFFDGDEPVFDQTSFDIENGTSSSDPLRGFFSDHVAFDISGMAAADRPLMQNGNPAERILFSGDAIGLGRGVQTDGSFDLYAPSFVETGVLTNPVNVGGDIAPGTYTVLEPDPASITPPITKISALQGFWRNYTDVLQNVGNFAMVIFPTTRESGQHQVVAFTRSGGTITNMWYGRATISGTSSGTFEIWSVNQLDNMTELNKASGTLTVSTTSQGVVKTGGFTVTTVPADFPLPASGGYAVYR